MQHPVTHARRSERGFTLIELLVVITIIGVLAAIALPAFLSQRQKGQDASAKSDVRNLHLEMNSCYQESDGFVGCTAEVGGGGLSIGSGPGQVRVVSESQNGFTLSARSQAQTAGAHHEFVLSYGVGGGATRSCTPIRTGGCGADDDGDGLGDW